MNRWMIAALPLVLVACSGGSVNTELDAEYAATGLDGMIAKAMALGFAGFNAADSANIDEQTDAGDLSGTIVVGGQVDQGASDNKGMRLWVALDEYADTVVVTEDEDELEVTYWTAEDAAAAFDLSLKNIPDGTLEGTLLGTFEMQGDLEGEVSLNLVLDGLIESDGAEGTQRVSGSTTITGTAVSDYGEYAIALTR